MTSITRPRSEDLIGQKFDRCLADGIVKFGCGFGLGIVFSVILFKRMYLYIKYRVYGI